MDVRSCAESPAGTGQNHRPNLVFLFDLIQCLNDRVDQLVVESIKLGRTFKGENGYRLTIAAGEDARIHGEVQIQEGGATIQKVA